MQIDVSVIIPAFNEDKEIRATVGHVLTAVLVSGLNCEVIVVNNDSTDKTSEILSELKVKTIFLPQKEGNTIAKVRNTGAKTATGKILLFVDADTWIPSNLISEFYSEFHDEKVICVGCRIMPRANTAWRGFFRILNRIIWASVKAGQGAIAGNTVAYRATTFKKLNGFDEQMAASEDQDLSMRASKIGKIIYLSKITTKTSARRLKKLGFTGLLRNWSETTYNLMTKKKQHEYLITR